MHAPEKQYRLILTVKHGPVSNSIQDDLVAPVTVLHTCRSSFLKASQCFCSVRFPLLHLSWGRGSVNSEVESLNITVSIDSSPSCVEKALKLHQNITSETVAQAALEKKYLAHKKPSHSQYQV
jgi:hypothetical protein